MNMSLKLMGKKKGMTRVYDEKGNLIVCTLIAAEPNVIVQVKSLEKDGYSAVQLGAVKVRESKKKNVSKPLVGHFARAKVEPRRHLLESRIEKTEEYELGQEVGVDYFAETEFVDVCGTSKGKGFQGVIKRHGFAGGPASHGSGFHRTAGSTGMRSTPGRSLPGVKKAGQMG
jgi:large subunit ribosomal protein L3